MRSVCVAAFLTSLAANRNAAEAFQSVPSATTRRVAPSTTSLYHGGSSAPRPRRQPEGPGVYSKSLPFLERPPALDGTYAGDVGFDPLDFAKDEKYLLSMREAEVKHARLAMLAAAGWPLSELWDRSIADKVNLPPLLDDAGRVPSVLNGGLGKVPLAYWAVVLLVGSAVEVFGLTKVNEKGYISGNLGIDPLQTATKRDNAISKWLMLSEIKNGRLAMLAITAYALLEFVQHKPVVESFSYLFQPLGDTFAGIRAAKGI